MRLPGWPEIAVIVVILLLVFGAARLPQVGSSLGRSMRAFKEAVTGHDEPDGDGKRTKKNKEKKGKKVKSAATANELDPSPATDEAQVASPATEEAPVASASKDEEQ